MNGCDNVDVSAKTKLKLAACSIGVTGGVYLILKYLLPLAAPFVLALVIALIIDKPVTFISKKFHIKRIISAVIVLVVVTGILFVGLYYAFTILFDQLRNVVANYDRYLAFINDKLSSCCGNVDSCFGLDKGSSLDFINSNLSNMGDNMSDNILPTIMSNYMSIISWFIAFSTTLAISITAIIFISKDMENLRSYCKTSIYSKELSFVFKRLAWVLGTYFKTQLIIMVITCGICTVGLYITGNQYALLVGVLIGLMDALPLFGTGTAFIPWTIILLLMGDYTNAIIIFIIYNICYYTREFLEPRLMGNKLGISPILMLISLYVGVSLFGIPGLITGPVAYIIIKEIIMEIRKYI